MASTKSLVNYSDDSDDGSVPVKSVASTTLSLPTVESAPAVAPVGATEITRYIDPRAKEVWYNAGYEELNGAEVGPQVPGARPKMMKNTFTGYVEAGEVSDFQFETQRRTFSAFGYALDPSVSGQTSTQTFIGDVDKAIEKKGDDIITSRGKPRAQKRRRETRGDAADIDGYKGPWAKFEDEKTTAAPSEEQTDQLVLWGKSKQQKTEDGSAKPTGREEKSILHIEDAYDYQGRSFLHAPQDLGIKWGEVPERCFLPKKQIHTWKGHTKGVAAIRFFPVSAHLLLSAGMDQKIKIWEVYNKRRCVRTYLGHTQAVRDICFTNDGKQFVSCGYDRMIRVWDTETGQVKGKYTNKKVPYCVKWHPSPDKQHLFVAGTADKKILTWDTRTGEIVQIYDRHLGAVNTINFVEGGTRMVSTSDDKSIRVWEWDIPVDMKYIADPSMHSMPYVAVHPNQKWMICQSMDNTVKTFAARDRFRMNRKKQFKGHMCSGYACQVGFSPCGSYVLSGDANGHCVIWDWKTSKLYSKFKAHDDVCIGVEWNPNETSKVATCGWDGLIKYWD